MIDSNASCYKNPLTTSKSFYLLYLETSALCLTYHDIKLLPTNDLFIFLFKCCSSVLRGFKANTPSLIMVLDKCKLQLPSQEQDCLAEEPSCSSEGV